MPTRPFAGAGPHPAAPTARRAFTGLPAVAGLIAALACAPAAATAQNAGGAGAPSSMFSNLMNPAIGMNALFTGRAAPNIDEAYGLHFDEAELSLISVVD